MEDILAKLVAMPTISDDVQANHLALDYIQDYLSNRGMFVQRMIFDGHGALVATLTPGALTARVMLYGHVDVLPAADDAFTLRRDGDKLYGRGTYDMKFAIASYMHFVDTAKDHLKDYDFAIMITSDEEYGGRDGINSIPHLLKLGYRADVCIMPDGGRDWNVEAAAKGHWRFDLHAEGKSGHSSRPWEGDSASYKLVQALHELRHIFRDQNPETDTLNIGQIHGDGTYNQIPSQMNAQVEIRLATDESYQNNLTIINNLCTTYDLHYRTRIHAQPLKQDISHPLLQGFMASITRVTGHQSKPCVSMAISDAEYFNKVGIPCAITYLPGGGHHGPSEWVSREALLQFPLVIADYLDTNAKLEARTPAAAEQVTPTA